jgi:hypothetical protein
MPTTKDLLDM